MKKMKKRRMEITRNVMAIWGGLCFIGMVLIGGYLVYKLTLGNTIKTDKASKSDVSVVLNQCFLGSERIEQVIKSYESERSFGGDHLDAYVIKISHVSTDKLFEDYGRSLKWYRMDNLPGILDQSVRFVEDGQHKIPWFPIEKNLRNKDFFVFPLKIHCYGISPTVTELVFVNVKENMVYYISRKI